MEVSNVKCYKYLSNSLDADTRSWMDTQTGLPHKALFLRADPISLHGLSGWHVRNGAASKKTRVVEEVGESQNYPLLSRAIWKIPKPTPFIFFSTTAFPLTAPSEQLSHHSRHPTHLILLWNEFSLLMCILEWQWEIKTVFRKKLRAGLRNAWYHSVQNLCLPFCHWKYIKISIFPVVLYGYKTWSFTLRKEHRLRVSKNIGT
jgi:hypothetical protein